MSIVYGKSNHLYDQNISCVRCGIGSENGQQQGSRNCLGLKVRPVEPKANKTVDEIRQKFDKLYPCINSTCDNNGTVINGYPPDDYFPEQCQYCDQNRFPILELIKEAQKKVYSDIFGEFTESNFEDTIIQSHVKAKAYYNIKENQA